LVSVPALDVWPLEGFPVITVLNKDDY